MDSTKDSFTSAWSKAGFPPENRSFVESFCAEIAFDSSSSCPRRTAGASRRTPAGRIRELRIHWGCTTGFTAEEAHRFGVGADEVRPSTTQGVTWLVSHPSTGTPLVAQTPTNSAVPSAAPGAASTKSQLPESAPVATSRPLWMSKQRCPTQVNPHQVRP